MPAYFTSLSLGILKRRFQSAFFQLKPPLLLIKTGTYFL